MTFEPTMWPADKTLLLKLTKRRLRRQTLQAE
jgi:hypothetical protein